MNTQYQKTGAEIKAYFSEGVDEYYYRYRQPNMQRIKLPEIITQNIKHP